MRQRGSLRIRTDGVPVLVQVAGALPAPARNLSLGGVFVVTEQRWAVGATEPMIIEYAGQRQHSPGRVTHIQPDGVGLAFAAPGDAFLAWIRDIIDQLLAAGDQPQPERKRVSDPVVWSQAGASHTSRLRDLSPGGAFVAASAPPPVGSEVVLYLPGYTYSQGTPKPSELRGCTCRVVRTGDQGFACSFVDASAEFRMSVAERLSNNG